MIVPKFAFRFDASSDIGMGHAVRCSAIASQLIALGADVIFIVGSCESAKAVSSLGFETVTLSCSNIASLGLRDGLTLRNWCKSAGVDALVIDTYGVSTPFFSAVYNKGFFVAYLDDLYTYELGTCTTPIARPVNCVINYGFSADMKQYSEVYSEAETNLLMGPSYAPLREGFHATGNRKFNKVEHVLVTTGSTNPDRILERLALVSRIAFLEATIEVVVGSKADFIFDAPGIIAHIGVDMPSLMRVCDIAISAAGSTLYELCALGVPTLAISLFENQDHNLCGFVNAHMGLGCSRNVADEDILASMRKLANTNLREMLSRNSISAVDGFGARRIAEELLTLSDNTIFT